MAARLSPRRSSSPSGARTSPSCADWTGAAAQDAPQGPVQSMIGRLPPPEPHLSTTTATVSLSTPSVRRWRPACWSGWRSSPRVAGAPETRARSRGIGHSPRRCPGCRRGPTAARSAGGTHERQRTRPERLDQPARTPARGSSASMAAALTRTGAAQSRKRAPFMASRPRTAAGRRRRHPRRTRCRSGSRPGHCVLHG